MQRAHQSSQQQRNFHSKTPHFKQSNLPDYKVLYEDCKVNVKRFMQMVEKEISEIISKHQKEIKELSHENIGLKQQIKALKAKILKTQQTEPQDISSFTIRSKNNSNSKNSSNFKNVNHHSTRSLSIDSTKKYNMFEKFDKIGELANNSSITDRNPSHISASNTLIQFDNILGIKNKEIFQGNDSLHSSYHPRGNRSFVSKKSVKDSQIQIRSVLKQTEPNLSRGSIAKQSELVSRLQQSMISLNDSSALNQMFLQKFTKNQQKRLKRDSQPLVLETTIKSQRAVSNKQNMLKNTNERNSRKKAQVQKSSVQGLLKNLRHSMQSNAQKQSHLQAPVVTEFC